MTQENLFSSTYPSKVYDGGPPHVQSDTSKEAAASVKDISGAMRLQVLAYIRTTTGVTCDAVEVALDMRHQTASARIRELYLADKIVKRGRAPTRSGRTADVWVPR